MYSGIQRRKEVIFDKYFITYPRVLKFKFELTDKFAGPEDPRAILKTDEFGEEAIITFNLDNGKNRKFYSLLRRRRQKSLLKFEIGGKQPKKIEKNWTPFFHPIFEK